MFEKKDSLEVLEVKEKRLIEIKANICTLQEERQGLRNDIESVIKVAQCILERMDKSEL